MYMVTYLRADIFPFTRLPAELQLMVFRWHYLAQSPVCNANRRFATIASRSLINLYGLSPLGGLAIVNHYYRNVAAATFFTHTAV